MHSMEFAKFPQIFKNISFSKDDIDDLMKKHMLSRKE